VAQTPEAPPALEIKIPIVPVIRFYSGIGRHASAM
jgi:hypothetical protein